MKIQTSYRPVKKGFGKQFKDGGCYSDYMGSMPSYSTVYVFGGHRLTVRKTGDFFYINLFKE